MLPLLSERFGQEKLPQDTSLGSHQQQTPVTLLPEDAHLQMHVELPLLCKLHFVTELGLLRGEGPPPLHQGSLFLHPHLLGLPLPPPHLRGLTHQCVIQ
ncbi:AUGMIN subunit 8-like isoform X1 [Iris pallida]|uniref:AUGMIN subunit 8-like isoform X1 n=1 Tax=Iris pallida TaxID=29817 RepID=A0AAX6EW75_IRIPA|nr:AUGMIN subunit 8-like isoform X1 [Iris pallida]